MKTRANLRLTPQILDRRITCKVHHCPSQPRGSALVRPGASALIRSFLYVFKPPTFVNSVSLSLSQSNPLVYRIVSSRIELQSRRISYYRITAAVIVGQDPYQEAVDVAETANPGRVPDYIRFPHTQKDRNTTCASLSPPVQHRVLLKPQGPISDFSATVLLHPRSHRAA